mmetsp:Transcript_6729/g.15535  ORF Transcript_6729/g.15535 Transcript_6729/m.15535 type:complete len:94 (-) Transcript_6729:79-360(-)
MSANQAPVASMGHLDLEEILECRVSLVFQAILGCLGLGALRALQASSVLGALRVLLGCAAPLVLAVQMAPMGLQENKGTGVRMEKWDPLVYLV